MSDLEGKTAGLTQQDLDLSWMNRSVSCSFTLNELQPERTFFLVSDWVRHKQGCTATENG